MRTSDTTDKVFAAFATAQAGFEDPAAKARAQYGVYVPLKDLTRIAREGLNPLGLAFTQEAVTDEVGRIGITTRILHASGEWFESGPVLFAPPGDPQKGGSALTYARRYSLGAILGIAEDKDDDGASASQKSAPPTPKKGDEGNGADRGAGSGSKGKAPGPVSLNEDDADILTGLVDKLGSIAAVLRYAREHHPEWDLRSVSDIAHEQYVVLNGEVL